MTTTAATKAPITTATPTAYPVPGTNAVVYARRNSDGSIRVWVELGGHVEPGWDYLYGNEQTARTEARRAAHAFHAHRTAARIEQRRDQLAMELATEQHRARRRMSNPTRTTAIEAELDALQTLGDRALLNQLVAHHTNRTAA